MLSLLRLAGGVALMALVAIDASATTARLLSTQDMAHEADVIAVGTAIDVASVWEERTLLTHVTLKVNESLKGEPGATIDIALPGGIDANRRIKIAMTFAGAPQIGLGEEVLVFLKRDEGVATGLTVVGFSQGKFSILTDADGRRVVSRDLTGISLESAAGITRGTQSMASLDELLAEIATYVR